MIVKMSKEEYDKLKEKYIYDITSNGLITTKAIDKKAYMFRTTTDKGFTKYMAVTDASEDFMRLIVTEATGEVMTFIEDSIEVPDEIPSPKPVDTKVLEEEITEITKRLTHEFKELKIIYGFQDYEGFVSY